MYRKSVHKLFGEFLASQREEVNWVKVPLIECHDHSWLQESTLHNTCRYTGDQESQIGSTVNLTIWFALSSETSVSIFHIQTNVSSALPFSMRNTTLKLSTEVSEWQWLNWCENTQEQGEVSVIFLQRSPPCVTFQGHEIIGSLPWICAWRAITDVRISHNPYALMYVPNTHTHVCLPEQINEEIMAHSQQFAWKLTVLIACK